MMNLRVQLRIVALATAIGLLGLSIAFLAFKSERQFEELRTRLKQVDSESYRIADQFKESLSQLNSSLVRFSSNHDPTDLTNFLKASHALDDWIDDQKPKMTSDLEKALVQQLDVAYTNYVQESKTVVARLQTLGKQNATLDMLAPFLAQAQILSDLGQALARAHFESRTTLLSHVNQTISEFRVWQLISLGCLFLLGIALAILVYRDLISPLRARLIEDQALLERQEKLAALGLLAAGVAHEIRNPLTAIKAALYVQMKKFQAGSPERSDARVVEREISRLEKIVSDFLLFARPAEPCLAVAAAEMPLQEVHSLLGPPLAKRGIRLDLEPAPELRIKADLAQIKQVLINLVQNAADAAGRGGLVTLRLRKDRKRIASQDTAVAIFEVTDSGKGIPPDAQKRLFDPFFTTKENGTGLGLSIAAGIIQKHGGALQYQTQVDCGTTFGIILPLVTE
jgi:signal transduction histidine kinase